MVELHFDEPLDPAFTVCLACEAACLKQFEAGVLHGISRGGRC